MTVTSEITPDTSNDFIYPAIGKTVIGEIVLFYAPSKGQVIAQGYSSLEVGYYSSTWVMDAFKKFSGSITLTQ